MIQRNLKSPKNNLRSASTKRRDVKGFLSLNSNDNNLSLDYVDQGMIYNALKVDAPITVKN